jgi:histidinol-phosphate aminotransferase
VDECFYEFCKKTVVGLIKRFSNLIILRSFSKSFSLAGLRFGYIIANERNIHNFLRLRQPSSVNILTQVAASASLEDLKYYKMTWNKIIHERKNLKCKLEKLGFKVFSSGTSFLYVKIKNARYIFNSLWKNKIFVLPS